MLQKVRNFFAVIGLLSWLVIGMVALVFGFMGLNFLSIIFGLFFIGLVVSAAHKIKWKEYETQNPNGCH